MRRWWRELRKQRERVRNAQDEVETSRALLRQAHKDVVEPLHNAASHNRFADMIRASLLEGRRGA